MMIQIPNMSESNQNIGRSSKSKLKLTELKDLCIQSTETESMMNIYYPGIIKFSNFSPK